MEDVSWNLVIINIVMTHSISYFWVLLTLNLHRCEHDYCGQRDRILVYNAEISESSKENIKKRK